MTRRIAGLCTLGVVLLGCAAFGVLRVRAQQQQQQQDWKNAQKLPGVDFTGLTPKQTSLAYKMLREQNCSCGCGMKMAQCRIEDPGCTYSKGLAGVIIDAVKHGKSENEALVAAADSKFTPKLLDPPVPIPVDGSPVMGPANAQITLVEFSDFQCPYCAKAIGQLDAVLKAYPGKVKLIFKQFPLSMHSQAATSAAAALAAHQQGKFWEMHNALFAHRDKLSKQTILEQAQAVGLDMKRFQADWDSPAMKAAVDRDQKDGDKIGVEATPTVFIDGQKYNGSLAMDVIKPVIEAELKKAQKRN